MKAPTKPQIEAFIQSVYSYYHAHGRHDLPWRLTRDPYAILVSEFMLQQTQILRVLSKYEDFLAAFPTVKLLANARLPEILAVWQGLGYNRRARFLLLATRRIMSEYNGVVPRDVSELDVLPGIGPYTAAAITCFAYNKPLVFIETNIRTAVIAHFFDDQQSGIRDTDIARILEQVLDRAQPREWYYALMDYGAMVKKTLGNASRQSKYYAKQSSFVGSDRQLRGAIISALLKRLQLDVNSLPRIIAKRDLRTPNTPKSTNKKQRDRVVASLVRDGLVSEVDGVLMLADR